MVVSDKVYKGEREDKSGPLAKELLKEHRLVYFSLCPNDENEILRRFEEARDAGADLILFIGGSGIGPNDKTVDVISEMGKEVPGFGELFRYETYKRRGPIAILSRAGMWLVNERVVVVTPGSPDAVKTALELLLPVLKHLIVEARGLRHK